MSRARTRSTSSHAKDFFNRIPVSTYRLQFDKSLTFKKAQNVVPYLSRLGVTDAYASPLFQAGQGSSHGYDVVDPRRFSSVLGTDADFDAFSARLQKFHMGLLLDIVPNHMKINDPANEWWLDVLENGENEPRAKFFDVDWDPPKQNLKAKILLPVLGDQFGAVLEKGEIKLELIDGSFWANYWGLQTPLAPKSWQPILERALLKSDQVQAPLEDAPLKRILEDVLLLPEKKESSGYLWEERKASLKTIKENLKTLCAKSQESREAIQSALQEINGKPGHPRSFDDLESILQNQSYRFAYWRVASDEINYRRFFDINHLAAIRVEDPEVFNTAHQKAFQLAQAGQVTGFRVDHVDGLRDPKAYLEKLKEEVAPFVQGKKFFVVVEKILEGSETLRKDWPVAGTTGYEFLNDLNGIFVQRKFGKNFKKLYARFTNQKYPFEKILFQSKDIITGFSLSSELNSLANRLEKVADHHRSSRDFTKQTLLRALREILAHFPVYRTYGSPEKGVQAKEGRAIVQQAIRSASNANASISPTVFKFIERIFLRKDPSGLTDQQKEERGEILARFQQLSGPVMAKSLEDTAFYRWFPLSSLNEVGGEPDHVGMSVQEFHERVKKRGREWPFSLNATTTHDTKRSEDARARLNVLSEIPFLWYRNLLRWSEWNRPYKKIVGKIAFPDENDEYLIYQTLIATWPGTALTPSYQKRIQEYILKAAREAKRITSWIHPRPQREKAMTDFIQKILKPSSRNKFLKEFKRSIKPVQRAGVLNSLSQLTIKLGAPGIPDFYQGSEGFLTTLVDPDNRKPVNFSTLNRTLSKIPARSHGAMKKLFKAALKNSDDGRIKIAMTRWGLQWRKNHSELVLRGKYVPLRVQGPAKEHVVAFLRTTEKQTALVVATRFHLTATKGNPEKFSGKIFKKEKIFLPAGRGARVFEDLFTGRKLKIRQAGQKRFIFLSDALETLPAAMGILS